MIITIGQALSSLCPTVGFSYYGDDYENGLWDSPDIPKPTRAEVEAEMARLQAIEDARVQNELDAKKAIEDKLAKLGLTTDDLKNILG